jgi:hypothetical protein
MLKSYLWIQFLIFQVQAKGFLSLYLENNSDLGSSSSDSFSSENLFDGIYLADPYSKIVELSDEQLEIQVFQVFSSFELEINDSEAYFMIEPIVPEKCNKDYLKITILGLDQKTFIFAARKYYPPQISSNYDPFELDDSSIFDSNAVYGEILEQSVVIPLEEASDYIFAVFTREFDSEVFDSRNFNFTTFSNAKVFDANSFDSLRYLVTVSYS